MKKLLPRIGISVLTSLVLTAVLSFGILYQTELTNFNPLYGVDAALSDMLYQRESGISGEIVVVGIDARSLEDFGPFPWPRDIMAMAIEQLNADPDNLPAAIGIDVLYTGESSSADADAYLAEAAGQYGNVITGMSGVFGNSMTTDSKFSNFGIQRDVVIAFDRPYDLLRAATIQGHINAMLDEDGILRHGVYFIDTPDNTRIYSFDKMLYDKYTAFHGLPEAKAPEYNSRGHFYVPFTAAPGAYQIASVSDLIEGAELDVGGKIVLIGPYASGLQDEYETSIDHSANMYGIEIHANIIESFRAGNFKSEASGRLQALIVFIVSLLCLLWFWDRRLILATAVWFVLTGGSLLGSRLLYDSGYVTHALWLPLSVSVLYFVTVAVNYIRASLAKRQITRTFKGYVDPAIVAELLKAGSDALNLRGQRREIAVLFVDIRGFTPLSEALAEPEKIVEVLDDYLTLTSDCVMQNNGTLDKFVGDATMAFWGAPLPCEDAIFKAVKAAMDMVEGSKAVCDDLEQRFGHKVGFGIGVHFGPAVVGNVGSAKRKDYTAIGDTVNTTARLEANAPAGQIYVSRAVADALEGRVKFTSLGENSPKLKGKTAGFEVLMVDALL
ncbi:MAG: adenylate/guanylate cyclase domain-containing protein [Oscillospiraceae bacterium]|jgi:adenylate cyclase|nr:adenylate/guanylate cyclase domain-containing protein [Oscillospiraceae bacterium]